MQDQTPIVPLVDDLHPRQSPNTQLAAALTALGIPIDPHIGAQHFVEEVAATSSSPARRIHLTVWTLAVQSPDGQHDTAALRKVWNDDAWLIRNRTHPLAAMRAAFRSYKCLQNPDGSLREIVTLDVLADAARDPALRAVPAEDILRRWAPFSASGEPPRDAVEYVIQAFRNHKKLVAFICDAQGPIVVKRRGNLSAHITRHTTTEHRAELMRKLNAA